jgi:hypothetical protein
MRTTLRVGHRTFVLGSLALLLSLSLASLAQAQATRTWVSGVGDDANPCSRTAPCKTFAGAISKTAPGGEINTLDPGGFGAVTITKAITISSEGVGMAGVLVSGTNAIVVNAGPTDVVTLRGLAINGMGTGLDGIRFLAGGGLRVERTVISGFTLNGISASLAAAADVSVSDVDIAACAGDGIALATTAGAVRADIDNVRIHATAAAVHAAGQANVNLSASDLSQNGTGVKADAPTARVQADGNQIGHNGTGVSATGGARVYLANNHIAGNERGLETAGGGAIKSFGNNELAGNTVNGSMSALVPRK